MNYRINIRMISGDQYYYQHYDSNGNKLSQEDVLNYIMSKRYLPVKSISRELSGNNKVFSGAPPIESDNIYINTNNIESIFFYTEPM